MVLNNEDLAVLNANLLPDDPTSLAGFWAVDQVLGVIAAKAIVVGEYPGYPNHL